MATKNRKAPAKLGNVWTAHATLFDANGKRITRCSDTPNAVAAALIRTPKATLVKTSKGYQQRGEFSVRIAMLQNDPEWLKGL